MNSMVVVSRLIAVIKTTDFAAVSSNEMVNIHRIEDCGLKLKFVHYMTETYSQMHCTDKYSPRSSIIWSVLLNG